MEVTNPFHNDERENLPQFSPSMFSVSKKTPSSSEGSNGRAFNWSIDQMARLDPVEIATDMQSFVTTNGYSPAIGPEVQRSVDKFFSQNTIQPSPWSINKPRQLQKHVTFSPHPPATNYYAQESFSSSQNNSVDVCTQTTLSIPVKYDIEKKLAGTDLFTGDDSSQRNGDVANSSFIRRKLFGQPQRDSMNSSDTSDRDESDLFSPQASARSLSEIYRPVPTISVTPDIVTRSTRGPHQQAALCSSPFSSSLLSANPALNQLPSPIADMSVPPVTPIKPISAEGNIAVPHDKEPVSFQSTPCPKKQLSSSDWSAPVSPIMLSTPAESRSCVTMATPADENTRSSQQSTSTPYNQKQVKRQLPVSPLASPLMKEKHSNTEDEDSEEEGSLSDAPAPLLLADLQSQVVDMTTSHTYFPQYSSPTAHMDDLPPHPLHSLFTASSPWRPNQHSTMLQQQTNQDHHRHLTTISETPSMIPAAPAYSSTAVDSCVMNYQDSAFSSCFHPTRSAAGLGLLDSVCPQSSMKAKLPADASLMEMSQQEADSGVLDTGHSRRAEKTEGLSSEAHNHGAVPAPLSVEVAQPTTFAPFSRSTPVPWITSARLNLPHAPFPSPFTLQNTNILPQRLRIAGPSPTRIVAPSCQYSPRAESNSPLSDELLRRKAYLKAKLKYIDSNTQSYYYTDENSMYHFKTNVSCSPSREDRQFRIRSPLLDKTREYLAQNSRR